MLSFHYFLIHLVIHILGFGETVAIAKEMAAREALKKIFGTEDNMHPINFKLNGIPKATSDLRYKISAN